MIIRIHNMSGLSQAEQDKIKEALLKAEPVLDSIIWESLLMKAVFVENKGYTNAEIIKLIRSGAHNGGLPDQIIDVDIVGFYRLGSVVGYTHLGSVKQWINRRFLSKFDHADIFHHVMHETMHRSFRFTHSSARASASVPYLVGTLSGRAFREFYRALNKSGFDSMRTISTRFYFPC